MSTHDQQRWREISARLDEALDLDEAAREAWLSELEQRDPSIAQAVRSLIAEREGLARQPLLTEGRTAGFARGGLAGQQLGAYTLDTVIGHGGMGTVWLAHRSDGRFEGRAAVKLLNAALLGRPAEMRFVREGSVLAKLRHPNIAQLVDAGVAPSGQPYLVLEHIEGERIDRYAEERNLSVDARVRLFLDVLAAVAHAHSHLIVHRDIKPSNILVTPQGVVKLLDFGVAALLGPDDSSLTREADAGLTPEYAAPEQLLRQPVTTATDVYALGLVLFVLLAGKHPLGPEGKSVPEIARATLDNETPRPSEFAEDPTRGHALRGDLDNIVGKALRKDPAERYSTAETFAADLRNYLACQPVSARPDSVAYRARKFVQRHRGGVAAGVLMALVLIGATVVTTLQMFEARRQRDAALYESRRAEFQSRFAFQIMSQVGSDGRPMTMKELMDKGIEVLETNYGDDPRFIIGMLVQISGRYMDLRDTRGEHAALVKAEGIARKLGDPERIAFVQCNTVETELALGRPEAARERMRDGLENLAKMDSPSFDRRTDCGAAQARLLWAEGRLPEAIEAGTRVAAMYETENKTTDLSYQTIASMLEVMLGEEGRRHEALEWNKRSAEALERMGAQGTLQMVSRHHNRANHLAHLGELREALAVQRDVVARIEHQQKDDALKSPFLARLGFFVARVEESAEGMPMIDRALATAVAHDNRMDQIGALLNRAQANVHLGRLDAVLPDLESIERLALDNPGENRQWMRQVRFIRAQVLFARGQPGAALDEMNGVLADTGYPARRVANRLAAMVTLKSQAELAIGRNAAALASARDAVAIAEPASSSPERSADVGAALMALASAQRAAGDVAGARASARRAAVALTHGLGPDHSETRTALQFQ